MRYTEHKGCENNVNGCQDFVHVEEESMSNGIAEGKEKKEKQQDLTRQIVERKIRELTKLLDWSHARLKKEGGETIVKNTSQQQEEKA